MLSLCSSVHICRNQLFNIEIRERKQSWEVIMFVFVGGSDISAICRFIFETWAVSQLISVVEFCGVQLRGLNYLHMQGRLFIDLSDMLMSWHSVRMGVILNCIDKGHPCITPHQHQYWWDCQWNLHSSISIHNFIDVLMKLFDFETYFNYT